MTSSGGSQPNERASEDAGLDPRFLECLICPLTHGTLRYDRNTMELVSHKARLAFPIRGGVPILLESEARQLQDGEG